MMKIYHRLHRAASACLLLFCILATPAWSLETSVTPSFESEIDAFSREIEDLAKRVRAPEQSAINLGTTRSRALEIADKLQDIVVNLAPMADELTEQLVALKPEPSKTEEETAAPAKESEKAKQEREKIEAKLAKVDGSIKRATAVASHAAQIASQVSTIIEQRFASKILALDSSPFTPGFWRDGISGLPDAFTNSKKLLTDGIGTFFSKPAIAIPLAVIFLASFAVAFLRKIRLKTLQFLCTRFGISLEKPREKQIAALLLVTLVFAVPVFTAKGIFVYADAQSLISWQINIFIDKFINALVIFSSALALCLACYAPYQHGRRLSAVPDEVARPMFRLLITPVLVVILGVFMEGFELSATWPKDAVVLTYALMSVLFAGLLLINLRKLRALIAGSKELAEEVASVRFGRSLPFLFELAATAIIVLVLIGYSALGWFISKQVVWIFTVLAGATFTGHSFNRLFASGLDTDAEFVSRAARKSGIRPAHVVQLGILISGLIWIALAVLALALIVYPFAPSSSTLIEHLRAVLTKIQIGAVQISGQQIILSVTAFLITIILVRILRNWMRDSFLPATSLDSGVRNSILTALSYLGYTLATLLAFYTLGIDLSNIALLVSALSVGIGFGLQSVVNNFVSGLILLVERPIRVGDWIQSGTDEGIVKKINVRATEVQTFSRETIVIPNANLISNVVKNRMLAGSVGRVTVPIGVAYGTDTRKFKEMLLNLATSHRQVLVEPAPSVFFLDFGDSALMFDLRFYVADINSGFSVASDLRFDILDKCNEEGIEIPFPQRDLHIRPNDADTNTENKLTQHKSQPG
jgi:potassium efflux system protein